MDASPLVTAVTSLAAGLLVAAGALKVPVPDGAMATLHRLGLPAGRTAARVLGLGEIAVGVAVVVVGGKPAAAATAVAYAALLAVAARQRARQQDCSCFGTTATAVSRTHLTVDAAFAATGLVGLLVPPWPLRVMAADAGALGTVAAAVTLAAGVAILIAGLRQAAERQVLAP